METDGPSENLVSSDNRLEVSDADGDVRPGVEKAGAKTRSEVRDLRLDLGLGGRLIDEDRSCRPF